MYPRPSHRACRGEDKDRVKGKAEWSHWQPSERSNRHSSPTMKGRLGKIMRSSHECRFNILLDTRCERTLIAAKRVFGGQLLSAKASMGR